MKKKEWERKFLKALKHLPKDERTAALSYYREMYGDKAETGIPEEDILREFGSPEACAKRIVLQDGDETPATLIQQTQRGYSVAEIIGICLVSPILLLPLTCVAIALLAAFGAVCIAGAAVAVGGAIYSLISVFLLHAASAATIFLNVGAGLILIGVGSLLFVAFAYLTKGTFILSVKGLQFVFKGRTAQ